MYLPTRPSHSSHLGKSAHPTRKKTEAREAWRPPGLPFFRFSFPPSPHGARAHPPHLRARRCPFGVTSPVMPKQTCPSTAAGLGPGPSQRHDFSGCVRARAEKEQEEACGGRESALAAVPPLIDERADGWGVSFSASAIQASKPRHMVLGKLIRAREGEEKRFPPSASNLSAHRNSSQPPAAVLVLAARAVGPLRRSAAYVSGNRAS
ncbi:hypothetical protein Q7P37_004830 [Cladosporium fusiforme]